MAQTSLHIFAASPGHSMFLHTILVEDVDDGSYQALTSSPKVLLNSAKCEFILLIYVKMPTIVGILTFISMINTASERPKAKKNSLLFGILVFMSS